MLGTSVTGLSRALRLSQITERTIQRASLSADPDKLERHAERAVDIGAGEILLQSIERDGTGNGLDLDLADRTASLRVPLILMRGLSHATHILEGLHHPAADALATANLFNCVGDSLVRTRSECRARGIELKELSKVALVTLRGILN